MTNERAIQILEILISIDGDVIIDGEYEEALEMAIRSLRQEQEKENVEKVCGTCTYWQEGTLDRGICQAGEPHQTHSAETCERWERHEEIRIKEQPSEDLEEAAWKNSEYAENGEILHDEGKYMGFIDGAKWQKKQMLKYSVMAKEVDAIVDDIMQEERA